MCTTWQTLSATSYHLGVIMVMFGAACFCGSLIYIYSLFGLDLYLYLFGFIRCVDFNIL